MAGLPPVEAIQKFSDMVRAFPLDISSLTNVVIRFPMNIKRLDTNLFSNQYQGKAE